MIGDRVGHVGEKRRVTIAVDVRGCLLEALILGVPVLLVREVPDVYVVRRGTANLHGTGLAEEVERLLEIPGIDVDRALDRGDSAVGKGEHGHTHVLCLQVVVETLTRLPVDLDNLAAHHPTQQVNAVNALVHEAAAVLGPRAAPGRLLVVALVAVPANVNGAMREPAEAPRLKGRTRLLDSNVKAILVAGRDEHAPFLRAANDLVGVSHRHSHGLLNNEVDPGVDAVESNGGMLAALGGNGDKLELGVLLEHETIVLVASNGGVVLQTMLRENALHVLGHDVADRNDIELVADGGGNVVGGDAAAADKGVLESHAYSTSILSRFSTAFMAFLVSKTTLACCCTKS